MTIIVESDPVVVELLRTSLGNVAAVLDSTDKVDGHLSRHATERVVVLGPSVGGSTAESFAENNRILRRPLGVVLVRPAVDGTMLANALRAGMTDVVETADASGLRSAVGRADTIARAMAESLAQPETKRTEGVLFTVFSTKGGVGKSLVATNLAVTLADRGRNVCLVDLDIQGGDVAIMLQLTPQNTVGDLAQIRGEIDASGVQSLLTSHSERLTVLAAPVQLGAQVPSDSVRTMLSVLKGLFEVVVVDTSGAFDDYGLHALDHSDLLVLVGTLDIPALKSLKLAVGTLDLLNFPRERRRLLLNRADAKVGLSRDEFEETLGIKVDAALPSSRDVLAAVNRGEVIVRVSRGHQVSKELSALAEALVRDAAPQQATAQDEHHPSPGRRALRRARAGKVA